MAEQKETLSERFKKLQESIEKKGRTNKAFSEAGLNEFFRGFDHPIIGLLEFLKKRITYYGSITCEVTGDLIKTFSITDYDTYQELLYELKKMNPKSRLDFSFKLSQGIFAFLPDISEYFSVYFSNENYIIDYVYDDEQHLTFEKEYETHITPDEIRQLRDKLAESIFQRVSARIDENA